MRDDSCLGSSGKCPVPLKVWCGERIILCREIPKTLSLTKSDTVKPTYLVVSIAMAGITIMTTANGDSDLHTSDQRGTLEAARYTA